jgi:large repetitive protein
MLINLPFNVTVGSAYKIYVSPSVPYMTGSFSPNFTITNTCPPPPNAVIQEQNSACSFPTLTAIPNGAFTFQWKKDGIDIAGATNYYYYPRTSGNYSVNIQNTAISYNSTSPVKAITVNALTLPISSLNPILCGTNTSTTISTSYTGAGYTYTWYKSNLTGGGSNAVIVGSTGSSITVTDAGRYYVSVNNGTCSFQSETQIISYGATGNLLNSNNTNDMVVLSPSQTENLKINLTGTGPWEVGFNDGTKVKTYYTATTPLIIPVSPTSKTTYSLEFVSNACGLTPKSANTPNWIIIVDVSPTVAVTFPTPPNLTVCKGNTIDIPYTLSGALGSRIDIGVLLADAVGGSSRGVYTFKNFVLEPPTASGNLSLYIPYDVANGSYSLFMGIGDPFTFTNYAINVVSTGCAATPVPTISGVSSGCTSSTLYCSIYNGFSGSGANTFQWYKNGVALTGQTNSSLSVYESGNYTVNVINGAYNQTSAAKTVTINRIIPTITSANAVLCGTNTSSTLNTSYTGAGYTYQWYKDVTFPNGSVEQIPLFGETASTLTVTAIGGYSVRTWDGSCLQNSKSSSVDGSGSLVPTLAFAVTTCNTVCSLNTSLASGTWSTANNWSCGHIPLATEPVQISTGHTITLDVNGAAKSLDLRGILNKQATKVLLIQGN